MPLPTSRLRILASSRGVPTNNLFRLKQFALSQANCAQRITTDCVLLGAWAGIPEADGTQEVIDAGCGCGILTLMLAQRFPNAHYRAIEIDPPATQTAMGNVDDFLRERAHCRIEVCCADFIRWSRTNLSTASVDLIICNPPYFKPALPTATREKALARYTETLSAKQLFAVAASVLKPSGALALVTPFADSIALRRAAVYYDMAPWRLAEVVTVRGKAPKLLLSEWRLATSVHLPMEGQIVVREPDGSYSDAYRQLTAPYLLDTAK